MTLDAGDLNRRITIQRQPTGQDASGQPITGPWETVGQAWASIRSPTGLGAIKADVPVSEVRVSIRVRWRTDVERGMRALHGTTVYAIDAVLPDMARREHVDLVCREVK